MRVIVVPDKEQMGRRAWQLVKESIADRPAPVLGLATGSTPLPLYEEMARAGRAKEFDFSTTITFNLDEYLGLGPDHEQSYRYFMDRNLFDRININKANTFVPEGLTQDPDTFCALYEARIADVGGIHCQVLGIGSNGHIAFNEPGSSLASRTRTVTLSPQTIEDNSRFFEHKEDVPTMAISMGVGTVLEAERVVLLADGANKARAVVGALEGPVTCMTPASALQLHPNVSFVITEDAAAGLTRPVER